MGDGLLLRAAIVDDFDLVATLFACDGIGQAGGVVADGLPCHLDDDVILLQSASLRSHPFDQTIEADAVMDWDSQRLGLFRGEVARGNAQHRTVGNPQVDAGLEHGLEILEAFIPLRAKAVGHLHPLGVIGDLVIEVDKAAAVFFGNGNSYLGRRGIVDRIPSKFHALVFVQFQIMSAGVKIPAPPKIHAARGCGSTVATSHSHSRMEVELVKAR